jgi:hypothetical protein
MKTRKYNIFLSMPVVNDTISYGGDVSMRPGHVEVVGFTVQVPRWLATWPRQPMVFYASELPASTEQPGLVTSLASTSSEPLESEHNMCGRELPMASSDPSIGPSSMGHPN